MREEEEEERSAEGKPALTRQDEVSRQGKIYLKMLSVVFETLTAAYRFGFRCF